MESWNHPRISEIRSMGLMAGIDIDTKAWPVLEALAVPGTTNPGDPGLLILSAGTNTLRVLPPYIISDSEIDQGLEMLKKALEK